MVVISRQYLYCADKAGKIRQAIFVDKWTQPELSEGFYGEISKIIP